MEMLKLNYQSPTLLFIEFSPKDIITSSGAFDGEVDVFDIR